MIRFLNIFEHINILLYSEAFENIGGEKIIELLVKYGSDMTEKDRNGMYGIHLAAINGNCGIICRLLEYDRENEEKHRKSKNYKNDTMQYTFLICFG